MNLIVKRQLVRLDKYRHFSNCAKTSNLWRAGSNPKRVYLSWAKLVSQVVLLVMEACYPIALMLCKLCLIVLVLRAPYYVVRVSLDVAFSVVLTCVRAFVINY